MGRIYLQLEASSRYATVGICQFEGQEEPLSLPESSRFAHSDSGGLGKEIWKGGKIAGVKRARNVEVT